MRERLNADEVDLPIAQGHRDRYDWAATLAEPNDVVMDVACGVGYGARAFHHVEYHGYDRPGIPDARFHVQQEGTTSFHACNLNDRRWTPALDAHLTCCFETLEHVEHPDRLAYRLARWTQRVIVVSIPDRPTVHANHYHLHDIPPDDVPAMFPGWTVTDVWHQHHEQSVVWTLRAV